MTTLEISCIAATVIAVIISIVGYCRIVSTDNTGGEYAHISGGVGAGAVFNCGVSLFLLYGLATSNAHLFTKIWIGILVFILMLASFCGLTDSNIDLDAARAWISVQLAVFCTLGAFIVITSSKPTAESEKRAEGPHYLDALLSDMKVYGEENYHVESLNDWTFVWSRWDADAAFRVGHDNGSVSYLYVFHGQDIIGFDAICRSESADLSKTFGTKLELVMQSKYTYVFDTGNAIYAVDGSSPCVEGGVDYLHCLGGGNICGYERSGNELTIYGRKFDTDDESGGYKTIVIVGDKFSTLHYEIAKLPYENAVPCEWYSCKYM